MEQNSLCHDGVSVCEPEGRTLTSIRHSEKQSSRLSDTNAERDHNNTVRCPLILKNPYSRTHKEIESDDDTNYSSGSQQKRKWNNSNVAKSYADDLMEKPQKKSKQILDEACNSRLRQRSQSAKIVNDNTCTQNRSDNEMLLSANESIKDKSDFQTILGQNAKVFTLERFLSMYVPHLPLHFLQQKNKQQQQKEQRYYRVLQNLTIVIYDEQNLKPIEKIRLPVKCNQSVGGILDDVIWELLQRRESNKGQWNLWQKMKHKKQGKQESHCYWKFFLSQNILCQGHLIQSTDQNLNSKKGTTSNNNIKGEHQQHKNSNTNGKTTMIQKQLNGAVDCCKVSHLFHIIHQKCGDDILRFMLLNCSIFIPLLLEHKENNHDIVFSKRINYFQVVGPPISLIRFSETKSLQMQVEKKLNHPASSRTNSIVNKCQNQAIKNKGAVNLNGTNHQGPNIKESDEVYSEKTSSINHQKSSARKQRKSLSKQNMNKIVPTCLHPNATVRRRDLFYCSTFVNKIKNGYNVFPPNHILSSLLIQMDDFKNNKKDVDIKSSKRNAETTEKSKSTAKSSADSNNNVDTPAEQLFWDMTADYYCDSLQQHPKHNKIIHTKLSKNKVSTQAQQIFQEIIQRHKSCDYLRKLDIYCPLPHSFIHNNKKTEQYIVDQPSSLAENLLLEDVSQLYTADNCIISFITSCINHVFPIEFWGCQQTAGLHIKKRKNNIASISTDSASNCVSTRNQDAFLQGIVPLFVKLTRNEQLPNKVLVNGIKSNNMTWLLSNIENSKSCTDKDTKKSKQQLSIKQNEIIKLKIISILRWMIRDYIIPTLRCFFYVTESEFRGRRVLYYRKPIWALFRSLSMKKLIKSLHEQKEEKKNIQSTKSSSTNEERIIEKQFQEITEDDVIKKLAKQQMGLSELRLLPKLTGVRPIATLCKVENPVAKKLKRNNLNIKTICHDSEDDDVMNEHDHSYNELEENGSNLLLFPDQRDAEPDSVRKAMKSVTSQSNFTEGMSQQHTIPTNTVLNDIFEILKYEYLQKPELFGCGLFGLHYFYDRYRQFIVKLKNYDITQKDMNQSTFQNQLFFASVDIQHCYDNIDQEHLLKIIDKLLSHDEYMIQKYTVIHTVESTDRINRQQKKIVSPTSLFQPLYQSVHRLADEYHDTIFVDGISCIAIKKDGIMNQLREHLTSNLLVTDGRHGKRYLKQSKGIPQGSILSSLLCNFYYGQMERSLFHTATASNINGSNDTIQLMVRMIDDFLMISPDKNIIDNFVKTMEIGKPSMGVKINREKTKLSLNAMNVPITSDNLTLQNFGSLLVDKAVDTLYNDDDWFPWCGLMFHIYSGQVKIDFTRFYGGKAIDVLNIERSNNEGKNLLIQMKSFVRPRCLPVLYDPIINTLPIRILNLYQMFVLCAIKTGVYLTGLSCRGPGFVFVSNENHVISCIESTIQYAWDMICKQIKDNAIDISFKVVIGIGWQAHIDVFQRIKHFSKGWMNSQHVKNLLATKMTSIRHEMYQKILSHSVLPIDKLLQK